MATGSVNTPSGTDSRRDIGLRRYDENLFVDRHARSAPTGPPLIDPESRPSSDTVPPVRRQRAIAQAITGERELSSAESRQAVMRAIHGDYSISTTRTTATIRRDGSHVGARDARIGALEQELDEIGARRAGADGPATFANVERLEESIRANVGLNAVAETLHVLGADGHRVDAIEDDRQVRIVADAHISGNAAYEDATDTILVSQSIANQAATAADALIRRGVLDDRGRIVPGREEDLDRSVEGDQLIKVGTLIAYHEQTHAEQDARGTLDGFVDDARESVEQGLDRHRHNARQFTQNGIDYTQPEWETTDSAWAIEALRIDAEEYDAYLAQEQADLALGASVRTQLVTDADGAPLDRAHAVENIVAMERGRALPHGPDAGWVRNDVLRKVIEDAGADPAAVPWDPREITHHGAVLSETPGWKRPGWKRPGWKRPGMLLDEA